MNIRHAFLAAAFGVASSFFFAMPALAKNILVSNLSWSTTEEELKNLFTPYGLVTSAKIITDPLNNNRSKGYGFVEMPNSVEADAAIAGLNNSDFSGRTLSVKDNTRTDSPSELRAAARKAQKKSVGGGGSGGGGGGFDRR